jgi:hypothetical protein
VAIILTSESKALCFNIHAGQASCLEQGYLRGIPHGVSLIPNLCGIAQNCNLQELQIVLAGLFVIDSYFAASGDQAPNAHTVCSQGSGLVRYDKVGGAQGFHRRKAFYQRVATGHAPHAPGQGNGGHDGQSFGNCSHCQGNGSFYGEQYVLPAGQADQGHEYAHNSG